MASITDKDKRVFTVSPNILISMDDNNMGEMYVYDDNYRYILNGATASDLIGYFAEDEDNTHLAEEIQDTMMDITINTGTH